MIAAGVAQVSGGSKRSTRLFRKSATHRLLTLSTTVTREPTGYRAYLMEAEFTTKTGHPYKLSTEARVTPDTQPQPAK